MASPPDYDFSRMKANIAKAISSGIAGPYNVLLTTGAMNPMHKGHVSMLHKVAVSPIWKESGKGIVVAAFLSPSNDRYLKGKFGAANFLPGTLRVAMAEAGVKDDPLVQVARWEVQVPDRWPDFPEVAQSLLKAIQAELAHDADLSAIAPHVRLWYVCGEDHYAKCGLHRGVTQDVGCCVVARAGKAPDMKHASLDKVIAITGISDGTDHFSSTEVRKHLAALNEMLHPEVLRLLVGAV